VENREGHFILGIRGVFPKVAPFHREKHALSLQEPSPPWNLPILQRAIAPNYQKLRHDRHNARFC
jgi:hypothetical protein